MSGSTYSIFLVYNILASAADDLHVSVKMVTNIKWCGQFLLQVVRHYHKSRLPNLAEICEPIAGHHGFLV